MATTVPSGRSSGVSRGPSKVMITWKPSREIDIHEWTTAGRRIGAVSRAIQWLLGDWIAYGNLKFGERYVRASRITGYDTQSLMNMVYVASRFSVSRRRENLSWSHHEAVAALDDEKQDYWLDQAFEHRWSVADLRMMLRSARRKEDRNHKANEPVRSNLVPASAHAVKCPRCGAPVSLSS